MQIPVDTTKEKSASKIAFFSWKVSTAPTVESSVTPPAEAKSKDFIKKDSAVLVTVTAKDNAKMDKAAF